MRRVLVRSAVLVLGAVGLILGAASAAAAQSETEDDGNERIVLTGDTTVAEGERAGDVVVFDGDILIEGTADGSVVAFNGDVTVTGSVTDDVVALNGRVIVERGATVEGDVRSSDEPRVDPGATVTGSIEETDFGNWADGLGVALMIGWWVAVTLSMLVLGLLFVRLTPRAAEAAINAARTAVGRSIAAGLVMALGVPILALIALVTLVGIPFGLIGLAAIAALAALGYVTTMVLVGRIVGVDENRPALTFVAGWAILRIIELVPFLGGLVTFAAAVFGLGALTVAALRAGRGPAREPVVPGEPQIPSVETV